MTIEMIYEKLVHLTELCDGQFKEVNRRLSSIETRLARIERVVGSLASDVIDLRTRVRDLEADKPIS